MTAGRSLTYLNSDVDTGMSMAGKSAHDGGVLKSLEAFELTFALGR